MVLGPTVLCQNRRHSTAETGKGVSDQPHADPSWVKLPVMLYSVLDH